MMGTRKYLCWVLLALMFLSFFSIGGTSGCGSPHYDGERVDTGSGSTSGSNNNSTNNNTNNDSTDSDNNGRGQANEGYWKNTVTLVNNSTLKWSYWNKANPNTTGQIVGATEYYQEITLQRCN